MDPAQEPLPGEASGSKGLTVGVATITVIVGLATVLWMWARPDNKKKEDAEEEDEDNDEEPVHKDVPPEHIPEGGIFTLETLAPLDGKKLPLCMGVCGKVVNCSASGSIRHGQGYGALWAGRDATYSLATLSLKPEDAGKRDFRLTDFSPEQQKALAGWYKHFTTKYQVIGTLREYDGWDFSAIEELAKEQTPFGLKKDSELDAERATAEGEATVSEVVEGSAAASSSAGAAAEAAAAPTDSSVAREASQRQAPQNLPENAQVFKKGDRVQLRNLMSSPDLNGVFGTLEDFNSEKGRFVIRLEGTEKQMLFKPENLLIVKE